METWCVIGDFQVPFQDRQAVDLALAFVEDLKPDGVILNGDIADCYTLSDFDRNPLHKETLQDEIEQIQDILKRLEHVPQKTFIAGKHEDRLRRVLWRKAPELGMLPQLRFEQLFGLDRYGFDSSSTKRSFA